MDGDPKGCVYLANEPFNVVSYQRSVAADIIPRFGSAAQGETDLDLLKALTQTSFRGGMFHKEFDDGETVSSVKGGYFNDFDKSLYFTPKPLRYQAGGAAMGINGVAAHCSHLGFLYLISANEAPGGGYSLFSIRNTDQATTYFTLPAALASNEPTDMVVHGGQIFICSDKLGSSGVGTHRFDGLTNTFVDIGGGFRKLVSWRGVLYGINRSGDIYIITNEFGAGTATFTFAKRAGLPPPAGGTSITFDYLNDVRLFNGAIYLAKSDGLFRYDGVDIATVFDYSDNVATDNFKFAAVFNGRYYYTIGSKIFEFDGSGVTLLQDLTAGYQIRSMTGGTDRLWIGAQLAAGVPGVWNDKDGNIPVTYYAHKVFCYNGVGFFMYMDFDPSTGGYFQFVQSLVIQSYSKLYFIVADGYLNVSLEPRSSGTFYNVWPLADEFTINNLSASIDRYVVVESGEIDNGFPSVFKTLNGLSVDYDGFETGKTSFYISAQFLTDTGWSDYMLLWNTQNVGALGATNDYQLHERSGFGSPALVQGLQSYTRMRYKILATMVAGSTLTTVPRIRKLTLRYTLQPRTRKQWQITLSFKGLDPRNLNTARIDNKKDDRSASYLRRIIHNAYYSKIPILFYDVDFTELKTLAPYSAKGTHFFGSGSVLAFANPNNPKWLNRRVSNVVWDEINDKTTFDIDNFGYRIPIGAATGNVADVLTEVDFQVRRSHAVYITSVVNDRYDLSQTVRGDKNGYSNYEGEITLKLVEV